MNSDCQKNIKKPIDDESVVDATTAKKPIGGRLLIRTKNTKNSRRGTT